MSAGAISSSASAEMMSSLMSCSSCSMGCFGAEVARQFVVESASGERLRARIRKMGIDGDVLADLDAEMACARRHAPPRHALGEHARRAVDAHRRDGEAAADREVRGAALQLADDRARG